MAEKLFNNAYYCSVHLLVFLVLDFFLPQPTVQGRLIKPEVNPVSHAQQR